MRPSPSPARSPTPTTSAGVTSIARCRFASAEMCAAAAAAVREGIKVTDEVGVSRTYGGFVRANGVVYNYELGDWAEADRLAKESIAQVPPGIPLRRYGLARWVPLLVSQGDPRAEPLLEELRGMIEGLPARDAVRDPVPSGHRRGTLSGAGTPMRRSRRSRRRSMSQGIGSGRAITCGCTAWGCAPRRTGPRSPGLDAISGPNVPRSRPADRSGTPSIPSSSRPTGIGVELPPPSWTRRWR